MDEGPRGGLRRVAVAVSGSTIVVIGVVLMPLPGPGTLIVIAGLMVLRTEFPSADRLLTRLRDRSRATGSWLRNRSRRGDGG